MSEEDSIKVVIVGGGIIGICTAYYLSHYEEYCKKENLNLIPKAGFDITIVERRSIASSASGYAGGFMARDWCEGERSDPLVRQSYKLHQDLAKKYNGKKNYDFRQVETVEFIADNGKVYETESEEEKKKEDKIPNPSWIETKISGKNIIGEIDATAQLQPQKFCNFILNEVEKKGVKLRIAEVTRVKYSEETKVCEGIYLKDIHEASSSEEEEEEEKEEEKKIDEEKFLSADIVILALGPWSFQATKWFPLQMPAGVTGHKCQSYLVRPSKPITEPRVYFIPTEKDGDPSIEIYPRPDGTVYICGMASAEPFPRSEIENLPFKSPIDEYHMERLKKLVDQLSPNILGKAEILEIHEATYLPVPPKNYLPIIGKLKEIKGTRFTASSQSSTKNETETKTTDSKSIKPCYSSSGVYIATGHNYWGIMTATGTGLALTEQIILGRSEQIDVRGLNPLRPNHEDEDEEIFDW